MQTIPWWNVNLGPAAEKAVAQAVHTRNLSMGRLVQEFENRIAELLQVPHVVAVCNGTSALTLALLEAGLQPGDEVIVPNRTWIATAHGAHLLGAKVVLVDVAEDRPLLAPKAFASAITARTRFVLPVHLNGQACDMPRIRAIAEEHDIIVIEDAAQALFSASPEGGYLGTHSHSACFSLSVAKIITSGQGGFVVTHNADVAARLRLMRTHGTGDIVHAHWNCAGGNYRFTDVLAAIALTQLDTIAHRKEHLLALYASYAHGLQGLSNVYLLPMDTEHGTIPLYIEVLVEDRSQCIEYLEAHGIQSRPLYPNLSDAPQFSYNAQRSGGRHYPHSDRYAQHSLFLPSGPDQREEDIARVLQCLHAWQGAPYVYM